MLALFRKFSAEQLKALMIIIKTNALANGSYNSTGDKQITLKQITLKKKITVADL